MKKLEFKRLTALLLAVLLLVSLCPTQIFSVFAEELDASSTISVSLILTDKVTNSPVAGVSVQLGSETVISDESGTAVFTVVPPAAEEQDMTYTVIAMKEGYQPVNTSVKIPAGQTTGIETSISMVPVADLTVEVYYGGELLNDSVTVSLSSAETQSTAATTNGVAVFPALSLIGNYQVSVQKPDSASGMYYVAGAVVVTAFGSSFDKVRLDVQKENASDAIVSFSIADADVSGSGVSVLNNGTDVAGLCYNLDAMITTHAGFWKNLSDTFEIALTSNNSGAAFLSNEEGASDPSGRYLTVTAVTESGAPIRVKVSEKASGAVIAEQEFAISVNKATPTVTYTVAGCPVEDNSTINFGKLGTSLIFAAEGDFKTEAPFSLNVPANDALKVDLEKNSVTNLKATLRADGEVMAIPVTFSRAADAWYQAASLSVKLQSCRDERPETGFGAVSYEDITVCMSDPKDFSVVPEIDSAGAPEDVQDSAAEITYELKDQTIYKMEDNTKVTNASVKLVTIGADGIAKINPKYYGTATLEATIKDTDCFLKTTVSCTLTVQKDIVDNNEKPFTLTYTDDQGEEQTLAYTYSDGAFVAEGGWIAYQITLKPNTGYDVQISGEAVPADGAKLAQGNVDTDLTFESGTYSSETVALNTRSDWTKPEVSYTFVSDTFKAFIDTVSMGIAVFSGDVTVQVDASDNEDGSGIQMVCVYVGDEERDVTESRSTEITVEEMLNKTISVTAKAEDKAGNSAEAASPAELPDGSKPSPEKTFNIIGDDTAPQINVTYSKDPYSSVVPVYNDSGLAEVSVEITEENYDLEKASYSLEGPTKKCGEIESSGSTTLFAMDDLDDGEYTLTIRYSDIAGYPAVFSFDRGESDNGVYTYSFLKDTTAPVVQVNLGNPISYTNNPAIYSDVNGSDNADITISVDEANYELAEKKATFELEGPTKKSGEIESSGSTTLFAMDDLDDGEYTLTITYSDVAGNKAEYTEKIAEDISNPKYGTVDSENGIYTYYFIKDTTAPVITVTYDKQPIGSFPAEPKHEIPVFSNLTNYNGNDFYGLPKIEVSLVEENYDLTDPVTVSYCDDANTNQSIKLNEDGTIGPITIDVSEIPDGAYNLAFAYTDIAGHKATIKDSYGYNDFEKGTYSYEFIRDTTVPVCNGITLDGRQDTIGNMEFYKGSTTGTASVTEQFFNPELFSLTANGIPSTVAWTSYPMNPASGGFGINGDGHYTLVLTGSDDAKHAMATYTYPATVVLDSTPPVISMTTPPAVNEVNQNRYFNDSITCTVEIIERNFYNSGAVQITCTRNGESYPISGISWSGGGDIHNGTFGLTEEGEYRISISYSDPSKNASTYTCEYTIIIDKTAPTVSIIDAANKKLEDKSAYSSKAVSFTISLEDQNLRQEDILIELKGWIAKDDENGNLVLTEEDFSSYISDISVKEDGKSYQVEVRNLKDDAVYTLKVSGEDLSGNAFNESRVFSVNRDGSTYYIEGETAELVKQYYTNVAHTVEIHEVCAEELKTTDISISHNLDVEKYELEEETESNKHFDVTNAEDCKWNEYVYQVLNTNFVEQGSYSVATSSVAKTTGVKKSSSEVVAVNFLMDTTVPTVNVAGIKDGGRYQTNAQEITITCQDDQMLQHVEVWLDDTLLDEYDFEEEMLSSKDITVKIPGANEYREQKLRVIVQDKAGNAPTEILVGVYVSTSIWNLYRNYILIGGGILVAAIAAVIVLLKKRKNTK